MKQTYSFFHVFPDGSMVCTQMMYLDEAGREKAFEDYKRGITEHYGEGHSVSWEAGDKERIIRELKEQIENMREEIADLGGNWSDED